MKTLEEALIFWNKKYPIVNYPQCVLKEKAKNSKKLTSDELSTISKALSNYVEIAGSSESEELNRIIGKINIILINKENRK